MALTKVGKEGITGVSNASNATAITIDSSENVGIGVSSPQEFLHIKDGSIVVGNGTASNSSSVGKIGFSTDSSNSRFIGIESFRGSDAANADLRFHTYGGDGNKGERMKIDTAGIMTVLSEGRAVTTSVQQGLTKVWIVVGLDDTTIDDSFNVASVTDTATGRLTVTITNDMASANYSGGAMAQAQSSNNNCTHYFSNEAAGTVVLEIVENGSKFDAASTQAHILGDLA